MNQQDLEKHIRGSANIQFKMIKIYFKIIMK